MIISILKSELNFLIRKKNNQKQKIPIDRPFIPSAKLKEFINKIIAKAVNTKEKLFS